MPCSRTTCWDYTSGIRAICRRQLPILSRWGLFTLCSVCALITLQSCWMALVAAMFHAVHKDAATRWEPVNPDCAA